MKQSLRAIYALILREVGSSQGRLAGGYLWAVIEPLAAVALLTFVFSFVFDRPPLGTSFALFYATGYLPFMAYADVAQKVSVALRFSRPLLNYPALSWWDVLVARFVLNGLVHIFVAFLVISAFLLIVDHPFRPDILRCALGLVLAAILGFGVGTFNAFLIEFFPIWERVWAILNRPLFIISGVMFLLENVPEPYQTYLGYNPIVHVIGVFRGGVYSGYHDDWASPLFVLVVAVLPLILGLVLLGHRARDLVLEQ